MYAIFVRIVVYHFVLFHALKCTTLRLTIKNVGFLKSFISFIGCALLTTTFNRHTIIVKKSKNGWHPGFSNLKNSWQQKC